MVVPRYVANEAARHLQAELCARGEQSGGWLRCRAAENHVKAQERFFDLGPVPSRCDKVRDDDGWRDFPRAAQSRINKTNLSNHRR